MSNSPNYKTISSFFITASVLYSILSPAPFVNAMPASNMADTTLVNTVVQKETENNLPSITYKKHPKKGFVVYVNNRQAVWLVAKSGKLSAERRAQLIVLNLKNLLQNEFNPREIMPFRSNKSTVVMSKGQYLFTADSENAKAFGISTHELALKWANDTRVAFGIPKLVRDYSLAVSRGGYNIDFEKRYLGKVYNGQASWYGGVFHGRVSSDGSRFNMNEFTAAHKSLPFGTLVKVTNKRNNKSCVVKITDRGPYVHGRIIDLSKGAAKEIGMLSSGVSNVEIEVLGKY